jgi:hypothetical protein
MMHALPFRVEVQSEELLQMSTSRAIARRRSQCLPAQARCHILILKEQWMFRH